MCGIFGYVGSDGFALPKALQGLKDLEYRGYDSWGLLARHGQKFFVQKAVGKISAVDESEFKGVPGNIVIGHSRWATHGKVTVANAHPHFDTSKSLAVVHNGVIENADALRKKLRGLKFRSQTDTEVIPHLIRYYLDKGGSLEEAVVLAAGELRGRFAFLVVALAEEKMYVVRHGAPIIIGKGKGEWFVASDIPAFLDYTRVVNYLDDDEYVILEKDKATFKSLLNTKEIKKRDVEIEWTKETAKKGDHDHFMIKEILEQKETLARVINQDPKLLSRAAALIGRSKRVLLVGCGTAGNVCRAGRYFFTQFANKQVSFVEASEFALYAPFMGKDTLVVAVSQSGETADVLFAVEEASKSGAKILSILNARGSSLERISDHTLLIQAGPEIAVASTKATSSQLATLFLLAYAVRGELAKAHKLILDTMGAINNWLNPRFLEHVKRIAGQLARSENLYIIGRSINYPIALETALKIQEIAYIHAEGFAGGEIKHGHIALITEGSPVLAFVHDGPGHEDIITNIQELKLRGARVVAVATERLPIYDEWIQIPKGENLAPITSLIPAQLLAYYMAVLRGNDPDRPRNLAKSVTVK